MSKIKTGQLVLSTTTCNNSTVLQIYVQVHFKYGASIKNKANPNPWEI